MQTAAVLLRGPRDLAIEPVALTPPGHEDIVVDIHWSGISTGTEKLFWTGEMPPFPGMGYPLVPGYEAAGEVVEAPKGANLKVGDLVFVPGGACFAGAKGLFGGASQRLITHPDRAVMLDAGTGPEAALYALAATARHALAGVDTVLPDLIVGHGVVGRLLARLTVATGAPAPVVWEINPDRMSGADGYEVCHPDQDERRDYRAIYDATGDASLIDTLISRLAKGGELVLAGFYPAPVAFSFPQAFMKEARLRVAAEWTRDDLLATRSLVEGGLLSLDGLISHRRQAQDASEAYATAFDDPACTKMILDWKGAA
ncbi:MAG: chlorophyll synthesis pathway protein BchC [Pseudomonadota bacterium]